MATSDEALTLLRSIDASLKLLVNKQGGGTSAAPDVDLDGQHGNPEVRAKDPRDWTGEPMKGRRFSECPAVYLEMLADRFDYFAGQEPDPKKAKYNRLDAARARGWAQRIRDGHAPQQQTTAGEPDWANDGFGGDDSFS